MMTFTIESIGIVHSPFKEKFGIPRQPGLVSVKSQIELLPPFNQPEAVAELDSFSHIWVTFVFHEAIRESWKPSVRPPRLGGNKKVGVFASRAPFRPNNLGLSVVRLEKIEQRGGRMLLHVSGLDAIDGTPVVDIKPYVSYVDKIDQATSGFAESRPEPVFEVEFSEIVEQQLSQIAIEGFRQLIADVLSYDPRPAYKRDQKEGQYGILLDEFNVRWEIRDDRIWVLSVNPA